MMRRSSPHHARRAHRSARLTDRHARLAVVLMFAANGAALGAWLPRIPELQAALGLSEGRLGLVLVGLPVGALAASLAVGPVLARRGSRGATAAAALALPLSLALVPFAGGPALLAGALALLGVTEGAMDAAMNTHAVAVQQRYGRSIVNGFHACWSGGALAGALASSAAAGLGVGATTFLPTVAALLLVVVALAGRGLLPGSEDAGAPASRGGAGAAADASTSRGGLRARLGAGLAALAPAGVLLGVAGLLGILESVPADWAAVHLAGTLDAPQGIAGLGFVAYAAVQLVGRALGDPVVRRLGTVRTSRSGALVAGAGLALAAVAGSWTTAALGFALVGLGLATVVPAMFLAAGTLPGVAAGQGIAWASVAARSGTIMAPPAVGGIAELAGLRASLALAALAALTLVALAGVLRPAGRSAASGAGAR